MTMTEREHERQLAAVIDFIFAHGATDWASLYASVLKAGGKNADDAVVGWTHADVIFRLKQSLNLPIFIT